MRAWTYTRRGSPSSVLTLNEVPRPDSPPENHAVVKVTHCALNATSAMFLQLLPNLLHRTLIPELDFAGIVVTNPQPNPSTSTTTAYLAPGTRVFGVLPATPLAVLTGTLGGTLAEYITVPVSHLVPTPANISTAAAAGLGAVGCTAIDFHDHAGVQRGDAVLVNGGSGGIGTFLVQLAKHTVGADGTVVAICSAANADMVRALGADDVVPYDNDDAAAAPMEEVLAHRYGGGEGRMFDAVIDTIGVQGLYVHCPAFLKEGKTYLNMGILPYMGSGWLGLMGLVGDLLTNYLWPAVLGGTARKYRMLSTAPEPAALQRVRELVESGAVKGVVDSVWDMDDALEVCSGVSELDSSSWRRRLLTFYRRMRGSKAVGRRARLSFRCRRNEVACSRYC